ncbi:hypothetical protein GWK47_038781 [Chionoecetes opilio]|uniref:Uncharacterized protein n=1 Tax=Chionoecetes opilio TaxID=41210 RepID=A0A8J5D0Q3_CHIOP|nr:hypothetical protein GWK47_038781 [Chionoecetes opilio]
MFLHAKHAATHYKTIILVADDTDVLIISLHLSRTIDSQLFIRREQRFESKFIDLESWLRYWVGSLQCIARASCMEGVVTLFSARASQGKIKALKLVQANDLYLQAFPQIWDLRGIPKTRFNSFRGLQGVSCTPGTRRSFGANSLRYQCSVQRRARSNLDNCRLVKTP